MSQSTAVPHSLILCFLSPICILTPVHRVGRRAGALPDQQRNRNRRCGRPTHRRKLCSKERGWLRRNPDQPRPGGRCNRARKKAGQEGETKKKETKKPALVGSAHSPRRRKSPTNQAAGIGPHPEELSRPRPHEVDALLLAVEEALDAPQPGQPSPAGGATQPVQEIGAEDGTLALTGGAFRSSENVRQTSNEVLLAGGAPRHQGNVQKMPTVPKDRQKIKQEIPPDSSPSVHHRLRTHSHGYGRPPPPNKGRIPLYLNCCRLWHQISRGIPPEIYDKRGCGPMFGADVCQDWRPQGNLDR